MIRYYGRYGRTGRGNSFVLHRIILFQKRHEGVTKRIRDTKENNLSTYYVVLGWDRLGVGPSIRLNRVP